MKVEEAYTAFRHVVGIMHDVSGQAKVTDLHNFPLCQKDIAGSQVPVDALHGKERSHFRMAPAEARQQHSCKTGHSVVALEGCPGRKNLPSLPILTPSEGQRVLEKDRCPMTSD